MRGRTRDVLEVGSIYGVSAADWVQAKKKGVAPKFMPFAGEPRKRLDWPAPQHVYLSGIADDALPLLPAWQPARWVVWQVGNQALHIWHHQRVQCLQAACIRHKRTVNLCCKTVLHISKHRPSWLAWAIL